MGVGGFSTPLKSVKLVKDGSPIKFEQKGHRIILKGLPERSPDSVLGIAVLALEFAEKPEFRRASYFPQLHGGTDHSGGHALLV